MTPHSTTNDTVQTLSSPPGLLRIDSHAQEEALVAWLQSEADHDKHHFAPFIPERKLEAARQACQVPSGERVLALVDLSVLGSAKVSLLIGWDAIYCCWTTGIPPKKMDLATFVNADISRNGTAISIGPEMGLAPGGVDTQAVTTLLKAFQRALIDGVNVTRPVRVSRPTFAGFYFDWRPALALIAFGIGATLFVALYIPRGYERAGVVLLCFIGAGLLLGTKKAKY